MGRLGDFQLSRHHREMINMCKIRVDQLKIEPRHEQTESNNNKDYDTCKQVSTGFSPLLVPSFDPRYIPSDFAFIAAW